MKMDMPRFAGVKLLIIPKAGKPDEIERCGVAVESAQDPEIGVDEVQMVRIGADKVETASLGNYREAHAVTDAFERQGRQTVRRGGVTHRIVRGATDIPGTFRMNMDALLKKLVKDNKMPEEAAQLFERAAEQAEFTIPRQVYHKAHKEKTGKSVYSRSWDIRPQYGE